MPHYLADELKNLREAAGLKQEDMQERVGIAQTNWTKYETGKLVPGQRLLQRIAHGLNADLDALWVLARADKEGVSPEAIRRLDHSRSAPADSIEVADSALPLAAALPMAPDPDLVGIPFPDWPPDRQAAYLKVFVRTLPLGVLPGLAAELRETAKAHGIEVSSTRSDQVQPRIEHQ